MFRDRLFRAYCRFARRGSQRRRRYTERGRFVQTGMVVCGALGIDTDLNLIYQLFALLACLLLGTRLTLWLHPPSVSLRRELPKYVTAGQAFDYRIHVTNSGQRVEADLQLVDNPVVQLPSRQQFEQQTEPGEETRNAYDRWIGYHRFMWLLRLKTGITLATASVPTLAIGNTSAVTVRGEPLRRGLVQLDSMSVLYPDPFALYSGQVHFPQPAQLLVLPKRYAVNPRFAFPGSQRPQPGGTAASQATGDSDEFVSLRDYRQGDGLRRIHWPSSARRGKPVIKEFQSEHFARQALVLDSTLPASVLFEEAIAVAASLLLGRPTSGAGADPMDLLFLSNTTELISDAGGSATIQQLTALANLHSSPLAFTVLAQATLRHASLMSGCVLVLGSWGADQQALVAGLRARQVAVLALILSPNSQTLADLPADCRQLPLGQVSEVLGSL